MTSAASKAPAAGRPTSSAPTTVAASSLRPARIDAAPSAAVEQRLAVAGARVAAACPRVVERVRERRDVVGGVGAAKAVEPGGRSLRGAPVRGAACSTATIGRLYGVRTRRARRRAEARACPGARYSGAPAADAIVSARVSAARSARARSRASTITRSTGSVPDGRSSTRPASAQRRDRAALAPRGPPCSRVQSQPRRTGTLMSRCGKQRHAGAVAAASVDLRSTSARSTASAATMRVAGRVLVEADAGGPNSRRRAASPSPPSARARSGRRPWRARAGCRFPGQRLLEAEIGHQRADHAAAERTAPAVVHRDDVEQLVAVVDAPVAVDHDQPVAVAVERDADVGAVLDDGAGERLRMGRAARRR